MKKTVLLLAIANTCAIVAGSASAHNLPSNDYKVTVESDGQAVSGAQVQMIKAQSGLAPKIISTAKTNHEGKVIFSSEVIDNGFYYFKSIGGKIDGNEVPNYSTLAVSNNEQNGPVIMNEITTIGSVYPLAQFYKDGQFNGNANGFKIGSEQVQNLANINTGSFGDTVLNGANVTESQTIGRMNVMAALMSTCGANISSSCGQFLTINHADNTIDAIANIAVAPYSQAKQNSDLFFGSFPVPEGQARRSTDFLPYLTWAPDDYSLTVRFNGGGMYSVGRMMFDKNANLWMGNNWMPSSEPTLAHGSIGGGVSKLTPAGKPLSPALTGYQNGKVDGIGWGTTVTNDSAWFGSFNGNFSVYNLDGSYRGDAVVNNGTPKGIQGLSTCGDGTVVAADNSANQLVVFPKGDYKNGKILKVDGLSRPFATACSNDQTVWVTNNQDVTVTKFPLDHPEQAQQIKTGGIAPRGIALDSEGNAWVVNNFSMGYKFADVPADVSALEEFRLNIEQVITNTKAGVSNTGNVSVISPEGKVLKSKLLDGTMNVGWGISIDGNDNVVVANAYGTGFITMDHNGENAHVYQSGILQISTDSMIDDAGNVWMANNWNDTDGLLDNHPDARVTTNGGGNGITVTYGIMKPVQNPLIGQVRHY